MKRKLRYLSSILAVVIVFGSLVTLSSCGDLFRKNFDDTPELIEYVKERTVTIKVEVDGYEGKGSGFFIDDEGTIVTCYHVIDGATKISIVTANNGEHAVTNVVNFSELNDLAIIKIDLEDTPYLKLYDGDVIDGEDVYAIGSPSVYESISTAGIVAKSKHLEGDIECIVSDAYISGGNSGGPLVNAHGEVVGVNARGYGGAEGLSIAININNLDDISEEKNWKMSEYKEWYAKEIQRSYRAYNHNMNDFEYSTIYTYQEVTDAECLYSTDTLGGFDYKGYKEDHYYYAYKYTSTDFDNYTRYLTNKGFELDDTVDITDANGYSYVNDFLWQYVTIYIYDNQYLYITVDSYGG